ncbi:MAG: hypothetical protein K8T89_16145, partial [Planctomycetes bacterium]|nr:hypothetical protein [Planctomycetota bacterium]
IDKQHHHHEWVVSSLHIHLGERHCLEVTILRGPAASIKKLGEELIATRGVLHGEITFTSGESAFNKWSTDQPDSPDPHSHTHGHPHSHSHEHK